MIPRRLALFSAKTEADPSGQIHGDATTPCVLWTAGKKDGYGWFSGEHPVSGRLVSRGAHVWAWEHANARPVPPGTQINHACDQRACVNPDHLYNGDHAQNMRDKLRRCRQSKGEGAGCAKLTAASVKAIRRLSHRGATRMEIAARFGVVPRTIGAVLSGKTWASVPVDPGVAPRMPKRLTDEETRAARAAYAAGDTQSAIAKRLDVSRSAIGSIVCGRSRGRLDGYRDRYNSTPVQLRARRRCQIALEKPVILGAEVAPKKEENHARR